jgi:small subunit ribosomal protein S4
MGDPRKMRKQYEGPVHPWQEDRIEAEKLLVREYGLKNKRELYKINTIVKGLTGQAKRLIAASGQQADREKQQLFSRLHSLGLLASSTNLDDVLGLTSKDLLERRLQTLVFRKGIGRSVKQARQFISHRHVTVSGTVLTSPNHLVTVAEEAGIAVLQTSTLASAEHPERVAITKKAPKPRPRREGRFGDRRRGGRR